MFKKHTSFTVFVLAAALLAGGCNAQDASTQTKPDLSNRKSTEQMHTDEMADRGVDVCKHWTYLAPVIEENIRYTKEFLPGDYLQEVRRSYELDQIPNTSGGYVILDSMIDAADSGKTVAEIEQLAISICRSFPPDAVDDAGGAYEAFTR